MFGFVQLIPEIMLVASHRIISRSVDVRASGLHSGTHRDQYVMPHEAIHYHHTQAPRLATAGARSSNEPLPISNTLIVSIV